jgi:hypothetical protein
MIGGFPLAKKATSKSKRDRRTKMEILGAIRDFIEEAGGKPFHKSDLREKGIDPRTAEEFFRIIQYCQKEIPRIKLMEVGASLVIQESTATDVLQEFRESMKKLDIKQPPTAETESAASRSPRSRQS